QLNQDIETLETLADLSLVPASEVDDSRTSMESSRLETYRSDLGFRQSQAQNVVTESLQRSRLADLDRQGQGDLRRARELQERLDTSELRAPVSGVWTVARHWNW